ncbi:hypothetical protein Tco_1129486, partial [Tanacetum coccineum]
DKLMIDLKGAGLEKLKKKYKNDVELEYHIDQLKAAVLTEALWNSGEGEKYATSPTKHYAASYHIQEINNTKPGKISSDKRIMSVVKVDVKRKWDYGLLSSIVVRRSDNKEYTFNYVNLSRLNLNDIEDMYPLNVEDKPHHLHYQKTLNLTKPKLYFEGIKDIIPYIMTRAEKGVVYLNQYNRISLMKLDDVEKICDGTLIKIRENLTYMVNKNELGRNNKRLRDENDKDIKKSTQMLEKIDQVMKHREQLRRFEEYISGCSRGGPRL